MAHTCLDLLATLVCSGLLELVDLLGEEVLQELVLIADFHVLAATALVVVKDNLELRDSLLALLADPVVHLFVRTVSNCTCGFCTTLEELGRPTEPLQ